MRSATDPVHADELERLLAAMTLEEKCSLTAGASLWYLPPVPRLGIGALKVSDGPSGVRGESLIGRRSLSFPCGTAVGATWNPPLVVDLGAALAAEARSKGVHVLLGPTVCIPRTPLAGRTFESFSEDPHLSARLAVSYVTGVQAGGVACCIKHYACNDQEHERMTISAEVDERALREVHLVPFEHAVREAGVWSVMTAYNKVNGTYCSEHPDLLGAVLRDDWGFDGLVMSDWFGTHSTVPAARAGLDLEMPGPPAWRGPHLAAAVRDGLVDEPTVDDAVRRTLRLMARVGLLDGAAGAGAGTKTQGPGREEKAGRDEAGRDGEAGWHEEAEAGWHEEAEDDDPTRRALARRVAAEGTVLLVNDGLLPLDPAPARVAVLGPGAGQLAMGGGSSEVTPYRRRSVAEALAERLGAASVTVEAGCRIDRGRPLLDLRHVTAGTAHDDRALLVEYFDGADRPGPGPGGRVVATELARTARLRWLGAPHPRVEAGRCAVRISGRFTPEVSGRWRLGLMSAGRALLRLDGAVVVDNSEPVKGSSFYGMGSEPVDGTCELEAGRPYRLVVELWPVSRALPMMGVEISAERPDDGDELARAVAAAADAEVAVVVVGLNGQWESEGQDRADLSLPGRQRELVEAVLEVNPRTVVVVNAGAPVEMPWAARAGAVLVPWYPGEEGADAVAEILLGASEPTGRLPLTFPARVGDTATGSDPLRYPGTNGTVVYGEGVFVGYRHVETAGVTPLFPFGHGLSYGDIVYERVEATAERVRAHLVNRGARRGTEVVQVYVRALDPSLPRPERELAGFAKVELGPGEQRVVDVGLDPARYRHWDAGTHRWRSDPGRYEVLVGTSSRDIEARQVVVWGGGHAP